MRRRRRGSSRPAKAHRKAHLRMRRPSGEVVFVCTRGDVTLDVVRLAGAANLAGKVVIDVSNPLDFSKGMPPFMIPELTNTNSLGEEVQKLIPASYVVKTF